MPYKAFNKRKRYAVYGRRVRSRAIAKNAFLLRRARLMRYARAGTMLGRAAIGAELGYYAYNKIKNKFSPRQIGEAPGTGTAKKCATVDQNPTNRDSRTLYTEELTAIPQGDDIDQRERMLANVRGFQVHAEIRNNSPVPLYVNVAILCTKAGTSSATIDASDFFRAAIGQNRARDFSTILNSNEMHNLAINSDRYVILRHKRYRLAEDNSTSYNTQKSNSYMNLKWYVPFKRQLRWDSGLGVQPENGEVFLVYWFDLFGSTTGTGASPAAATSAWRVVTTFRDPKN